METNATERLRSNVYRERMDFNDTVVDMQKSLNELLNKYNRVSGLLEHLLAVINEPRLYDRNRIKAIEQFIADEVHNSL
jgi:hypothetical protein